MQQRLAKFRRQPERVSGRELTTRSLTTIATIARYPFVPTSLLVRLVSGNEDVTHRHLQLLYHRGLVARFAFPGPGNPGEFHYFLDNPTALELLSDHVDDIDVEAVRRNREKRYADVHDRSSAPAAMGRMLFLQHEAMISRFHAALELACRASNGAVELASWRQGAQLWNRVTVPVLRRDPQSSGCEAVETLPHRPDAFFTLHFQKAPAGQNRAHFFYEADRKTTTDTNRFARKLRAYVEFVRQGLHEKCYGIKRVRAVLVETLDMRWADRLRQAARRRIVSGDIPSSLFWFTASSALGIDRHLAPAPMFKRMWATAVDDRLRSLVD